MRRFRVIGSCEVAGRQPGETISETDLPNINIDALIRSNHLAVIGKTKETKNAETSDAEPGDHDQLGEPE